MTSPRASRRYVDAIPVTCEASAAPREEVLRGGNELLVRLEVHLRVVVPVQVERMESGQPRRKRLVEPGHRTRTRPRAARSDRVDRDSRAMLFLVPTARRLHHSYAQYLALLELSPIKLEYCEGEIYAMAGGTPTHADLGASATRLLGNALLGRCRVSSSDLKVRVEPTDLTTFPDVTVVCGERRTSTIDRTAVVNPTLLVEVTSRSTEDYDRGEKLSHYKQLDSLVAVLIISHRRAHVTLVERVGEGWRQQELRAGENVVVEALSLTLSVNELYEGIDLGGPEP